MKTRTREDEKTRPQIAPIPQTTADAGWRRHHIEPAEGMLDSPSQGLWLAGRSQRSQRRGRYLGRCGKRPYLFHMEALPSESGAGKVRQSVTEVNQVGLQINGLRKVIRIDSHPFLSRTQAKRTEEEVQRSGLAECRAGSGGFDDRGSAPVQRAGTALAPGSVPGFRPYFDHERRENSRLFPPFPPLTAFRAPFFIFDFRYSICNHGAEAPSIGSDPAESDHVWVAADSPGIRLCQKRYGATGGWRSGGCKHDLTVAVFSVMLS
jgi:hypothetical protein